MPPLFSASSNSFLGQIYGLLGLTNIADEADTDGSGFPQLASEYIVSQDPDIIYLADVDFGVTPESLSERPGWAEMTAVQNGAIVPLEAYLASNWGPRVVELLELIAESVTGLVPAVLSEVSSRSRRRSGANWRRAVAWWRRPSWSSWPWPGCWSVRWPFRR